MYNKNFCQMCRSMVNYTPQNCWSISLCHRIQLLLQYLPIWYKWLQKEQNLLKSISWCIKLPSFCVGCTLTTQTRITWVLFNWCFICCLHQIVVQCSYANVTHYHCPVIALTYWTPLLHLYKIYLQKSYLYIYIYIF